MTEMSQRKKQIAGMKYVSKHGTDRAITV